MNLIIKDRYNTLKKSTLLILILFVFSLPYGYALNNIIFGLFCFGSLLFYIPKYNDIKHYPIVFILPLFYFYIFFVCLINNEIIESFKYLNLYLPFLASPLLFFSLTSKKVTRKVLIAFIITVIFYAIICYATVFYDILTSHRSLKHFFSWWYTSSNLVKYTGLHTTYAGLLVNLGIASIFILFKNHKSLFKKLVWFIPLLILFNFSIASRMQSILLILICFTFLLILKINWILRLSMFILLLLIPILLYNISPYISQKIDNIITTENYNNVDKVKDPASFNARLSFLSSGIKTSLNAPLFGYGMTNGRTELEKGFKRDGLDWVLKSTFNAHNQYVEYFVRIGWFGLLIFVLMFLIPFYYGIKNKADMLPYFLFCIIFLLSFLSESILLRQKGVIFFTLFYVFTCKLLAINYK